MTTPTSEAPLGDTPTWLGDAADYDAWFDTPWGRHAYAMESNAIARAVGAVGHGRVLDAGCGTGRFGAALAGHHAVTGIDADAGMLHLARARTTAGCRATVEHLPFPDGTFDLTLAVTVLEFVADPTAALAELARVTRGGGRVVVGALNPRSPWRLANRRRLRSGVWCQARFLSRRALRHLAVPYGTAVLRGSLYAPLLVPGISLIETLGRLAPPLGAFQVLAVHKVVQ